MSEFIGVIVAVLLVAGAVYVYRRRKGRPEQGLPDPYDPRIPGDRGGNPKP